MNDPWAGANKVIADYNRWVFWRNLRRGALLVLLSPVFLCLLVVGLAIGLWRRVFA